MEINIREKIKNSNRIYFDIILNSTKECIGYIELRFGHSLTMYYYGNIGYHILEEYRGHSYAYQACVLLLEYARKLDLDYLIITASPDNIPSVKTIEKLPVRFVETTRVPVWHPLYRYNERVKNVYRIDLK